MNNVNTLANAPTLAQRARNLRRNALRMGEVPGQGYIAQALDIADVLAVAYFHAMRFRPEDPAWEERDRFLLSNGHYAIALYAALIEAGIVPEAELETYGFDESRLPMSGMASYTPGMEMSGGSLGLGLSIAVGMGLGLKRKGSDSRVYTLFSDGELDEGSKWEAMMSAAHHKLDNLCIVIDYNKLQSDDFNSNIMGLEPLGAKWRAFDWAVAEIDGHDIRQILHTFYRAGGTKGRPQVIIAHTVKGKGVSYMENIPQWHGSVKLTRDQAETALKLLGAQRHEITELLDVDFG